MARAARALVHAWLVLDFFGDSRRTGGQGSTLTTTVFTQAFLSLVFAAILYPDIPPVPFAAANLSLSTLLMGVGALGDEPRAQRYLADRVLVATAPLPRATVAAARALHGAFFVCLLTLGMALAPAILLGFLLGEPWVVPGYAALACLLAGLMTGGLTVLLDVARLVIGPARAALLSGTLKALLLAFGVVAFATCLRLLDGTAEDLPFGRLGAELFPPYWAARWLNAPVADLRYLGALVSLGAVLWIAGLLVPLRERASTARHGRRGPLLAMLHAFAGSGPLRGLGEFTARMIYRSPGFRARVLPLAGVPAAMVFMALQDAEPRATLLLLGMTLQFPAIYLPFLVAFLPRSDVEGAEQVFASAPDCTLEMGRRAAFLALCTHVLLPVHVVALLGLPLLGIEWQRAVALSTFAAGVSVHVAAQQVRALPALPFSSPGEDPATDLGGVLGLALVLALLGGLLTLVASPLLALGLGLLAALTAFRRLATAGARLSSSV